MSSIIQCRETNKSASFSVWIAPKPAFSQLNSFIFKFTSRVSENCFLTLTKKQAVKLTRQESKSINNIKALLSSFTVGFQFASAFIESIKVSYNNEQFVRNKWVITQVFWRVSLVDLIISDFFPAYSFISKPEAWKLLYNPHPPVTHTNDCLWKN